MLTKIITDEDNILTSIRGFTRTGISKDLLSNAWKIDKEKFHYTRMTKN